MRSIGKNEWKILRFLIRHKWPHIDFKSNFSIRFISIGPIHSSLLLGHLSLVRFELYKRYLQDGRLGLILFVQSIEQLEPNLIYSRAVYVWRIGAALYKSARALTGDGCLEASCSLLLSFVLEFIGHEVTVAPRPTLQWSPRNIWYGEMPSV